MPSTRKRRAALLLVAMMCLSGRPAAAGRVLFDVAEGELLEAVDADAVVAPGRAHDLLLVALLRERLAAGELSLRDRATFLPVAGDRGPRLPADGEIEIGELLQLLLMTDSRGAAKTLAWAAGPSIGRTLARMQQLSARLGLVRTTLADDWPFGATPPRRAGAGRRGATTPRELGRLALLIASDPEMRRRLSLDGVPISDGGLIVRATAPLIALDHGGRPAAADADGEARIALAERDHLTLLAVATGPNADAEVAATLARGFARYRRVEVVRTGQAVGPLVRVRGGIIPTFNAVAAEAWATTTERSSPAGLAFRLQLPTEIEAPVEVHQPLGELVVERAGRVLAVVPLVAPLAIAPSGWLDTARR